MRQPYETLLGHCRDHCILGPYLKGDYPDWDRLFEDSETLSAELDLLSSGEVELLWIALAFWNGNPTARVAGLGRLDRSNRQRVAVALCQNQ